MKRLQGGVWKRGASAMIESDSQIARFLYSNSDNGNHMNQISRQATVPENRLFTL